MEETDTDLEIEDVVDTVEPTFFIEEDQQENQ